VHAAMIDLVDRCGWDDVEVVGSWTEEEIARREEDALRVGARFDLGDLLIGARNLITNARKYGAGGVRVVVTATQVEVHCEEKTPLLPEFWDELKAWLNGGDQASEPVNFTPRTGLRAVRRSIRRNLALNFTGGPGISRELSSGETDDDLAVEMEEGRGVML